MKNLKKYFWLVFLILPLLLFSKVDAISSATTSPTSSGTFFGATSDTCAFWKNIFNFGIQIAGGLALIVLAVGGILYLVSMGSTDKQKTAKDIMYGSVFGVALALMSWTLFTVLNPYLLQCNIKVEELNLCDGLNCVFDNCRDKWGVDRCFAEVVAYNESGFQPDAQLKHGNLTIQYQGLYGISWSEMESYNKANGTNFTKDQLQNAEVNGEVACWKYSKVYLDPKYYWKINNPASVYGEDERMKYLMTYLAAGSGPAALNWMIGWSKANYGVTNDKITQEMILQAQYEWGKKLIKDRYAKSCLNADGSSKNPGQECCNIYPAEKLWKTCSPEDVTTNGEEYGRILRGAKVKMINNYDRCKEGKSLYDSTKKY